MINLSFCQLHRWSLLASCPGPSRRRSWPRGFWLGLVWWRLVVRGSRRARAGLAGGWVCRAGAGRGPPLFPGRPGWGGVGRGLGGVCGGQSSLPGRPSRSRVSSYRIPGRCPQVSYCASLLARGRAGGELRLRPHSPSPALSASLGRAGCRCPPAGGIVDGASWGLRGPGWGLLFLAGEVDIPRSPAFGLAPARGAGWMLRGGGRGGRLRVRRGRSGAGVDRGPGASPALRPVAPVDGATPAGACLLTHALLTSAL